MSDGVRSYQIAFFRRLLAEFETECVLLRAHYDATMDERTDLQSIRRSGLSPIALLQWFSCEDKAKDGIL
jgi:hypothetical protein